MRVIDNIELVKASGKAEKFYSKLVDELIRQRYSISDEIALNRQRDTKQEAFNEYNNYCENCKLEAKQLLGID